LLKRTKQAVGKTMRFGFAIIPRLHQNNPEYKQTKKGFKAFWITPLKGLYPKKIRQSAERLHLI